MPVLDYWGSNKAYIISADTMVAYLAYVYLSIRCPFPSHGGERLCLYVAISTGV